MTQLAVEQLGSLVPKKAIRRAGTTQCISGALNSSAVAIHFQDDVIMPCRHLWATDLDGTSGPHILRNPVQEKTKRRSARTKPARRQRTRKSSPTVETVDKASSWSLEGFRGQWGGTPS